MTKPRIMIVCGFGLGSRVILRRKLDRVLSQHGLEARTFCADVTTAPGQTFDVVFTSRELVDTFADVDQPVVVIDNFLSETEVEAKALPVIRPLIADED